MKNERLVTYLQEKKTLVDQRLPIYMKNLQAPDILKESMLYSLQAGGKRLRPILLLATLEAFGQDDAIGIDIACALEMIHTYSLIHDDLPSMDDDDLRRGVPTNHKMFGEAIAILAGDALLTYSFSVISKNMDVTAACKLDLIERLADAAGPAGMVGGQVADLEAEGKMIALPDIEAIHMKKTGQLLMFSVTAAGVLANCSHEQLTELEQFAHHLGLAFQITDDILDLEGDEMLMGKPVGSDLTNQKSTYPSILTVDGAKLKCEFHLKKAKEHLYQVGIDHTILEQIADYMVDRNH